ncbi:hypothetical protein FRC07_009550 [Ceratobasidium sp. 392]|nr:hypothetical protein FRC07_009550 [Ceratobasidium sp. 392]
MPMNVLVAMKDVATDSERVAQEMAVRFRDTSSVYFRFSVNQGMQNARMSHWQKRNEVVAHTRAYIQKAEVTSQMDEAAKAMVARKGTLRAEGIGGKVQQLPVQQTIGVKRCPAPSPAFTGCERQVSHVVNCLLSPASERRVCVVHGLGGSGKTQIALKAVERTLDNWEDILYVDATTRETAISALEGFARAKKIGETHEEALQWLEVSSKSWLLVFDNADDPDLGLPRFIPGGSRGSVLITTRLRTLVMLGRPHGSESECVVGGMNAEDALELLLRKARMQNESLPKEEVEAAIELVQDLGYLALAIVHAGAYIWCSKTSVVKYRKQCLEQTQTALEKYSKLPGNIEEYEKTVYTTWVMSYERLKPQAQQVLGLMAYLHRGGITEEIFQRAARGKNYVPSIPLSDEETATRKYVLNHLERYLDIDGRWNSSAFSAVMDELVLYSLVDYDRANEAYTLHVLVQDWASTMSIVPMTAAGTHTSHLLALSIDLSNDIGARTYRRQLLLHVSGLLDELVVANPNDAAFFAMVYIEAGRWHQAEPLQIQVVDAQKQALGELHSETLTSMNNLAMIYGNQGRLNEAESLQVQVLNARSQISGKLHPETLTCVSNLALNYYSQGRWDEAESLQVQVLYALNETLDKPHRDTLIIINNLALTYQNQGRWDEAEFVQVQILNTRKELLGELHPDTLTSMDNLAITYQAQGRWAEAELLQVQVLDARKKVLGELHPDTLTVMSNLASSYMDQDRWGEAESLNMQVFDGLKQTLGGLHPYTLTSMNNLAATYMKQGRWGEAELLQVRVLDAMKQTVGELHPNTLTSMHNLAVTYLSMGRLADAAIILARTVASKVLVFGEAHPETLQEMKDLAGLGAHVY